MTSLNNSAGWQETEAHFSGIAGTVSVPCDKEGHLARNLIFRSRLSMGTWGQAIQGPPVFPLMSWHT